MVQERDTNIVVQERSYNGLNRIRNFPLNPTCSIHSPQVRKLQRYFPFCLFHGFLRKIRRWLTQLSITCKPRSWWFRVSVDATRSPASPPMAIALSPHHHHRFLFSASHFRSNPSSASAPRSRCSARPKAVPESSDAKRSAAAVRSPSPPELRPAEPRAEAEKARGAAPKSLNWVDRVFESSRCEAFAPE